MVNGVSGIGAASGLEQLKEIIQETVEETLEAEKTKYLQEEEIQDEEPQLEEMKFANKKITEKNTDVVSLLSTAITNAMTSIMEMLVNLLGIGQTNETQTDNDNILEQVEPTGQDMPKVNRDVILSETGLIEDYTKGTWTSSKVSWKNDAGKDVDRCRDMAKSQAIEYASSVLNQLESAIIAKLGDSCTDEMKDNISKVKANVLKNQNWLSTEWHTAMLGKNRGYTASCDTQALIDEFFTEFNRMRSEGL